MYKCRECNTLYTFPERHFTLLEDICDSCLMHKHTEEELKELLARSWDIEEKEDEGSSTK